MRISDWSSDVCSSDLAKLPVTRQLEEDQQDAEEDEDARCDHGGFLLHARECARAAGIWRVAPGNIGCGVGPLRSQTKNRSEEHTSELQSLMRISYAVLCLKKKKKKYT